MTSAFVPRSFVAIGDSFTEGLDDADGGRPLPRLGGPGRRGPRQAPARRSPTPTSRSVAASCNRSSTSRCPARSRWARPRQPGRRHQRRAAAEGRHRQAGDGLRRRRARPARERSARAAVPVGRPDAALAADRQHAEPDQGADPHRRADGRPLRLLPGPALGRAGLRAPGGVERRPAAPVARGPRPGRRCGAGDARLGRPLVGRRGLGSGRAHGPSAARSSRTRSGPAATSARGSADVCAASRPIAADLDRTQAPRTSWTAPRR